MHLGAALRFIVIEVELLIGLGGFTAYQTLINSECYNFYSAVRAWVLRSMSERERTQTTSQGPQIYTKLFQRGPIALTARMLAWKQPFIQRVRNSSLVERLGVDNNRAQSILPKLWDFKSVGEHSSCTEGVSQGMLERLEKKMQEQVTIKQARNLLTNRLRFPDQRQSDQGQSGPKANPKGVVDGQLVNIPVLAYIAMG
eukprot:TRINITY_DN665_c0_g1_i3.p1 TRINITY_DN665_c0_g1~~TRINITY_DN665_c0_g1_i3.p1  ORF type:complete len:199 (-),score=0.61 TRINITY_DN665_c0_g1_i3:214-810(-)